MHKNHARIRRSIEIMLAATGTLAISFALEGCGKKDSDSVSSLNAIPLTSSCTAPTQGVVGTDYTLTSNVTYYSPGGSAQQMDFYLPTSVTINRPVVVYFHGGAFAFGTKTDPQAVAVAQHLVTQGIAVVSVNYRLVSGASNLPPVQLRDARCAVRYIRQNAATYGIDSTKIAAMGDSSGGHLAAILAENPTVADLDDSDCTYTASAEVASALDFYGPMDFSALSHFGSTAFINGLSGQDLIRLMFNGDPASNPTLASEISPLTYVSSSTAPILISHGTDDSVVPVEHAQDLRDKMVAASRSVTYIEVSGKDHLYLTNDATAFWNGTDSAELTSMCTTSSFLKATLSL